MVVMAVVAGVLLPKLDELVDPHLSVAVKSILFGGGASEARQLLSSIASGLITTVSLTFSLTVVVFQLASSQYSPRLLRLFPRDNTTRATLGLLAGTFVYSLTVLRTVREDGVPRISVTFGYALTAAGVLLLVVFLGHIVKELRVETMLRRVHREQDRVVHSVLGDDDDVGSEVSPPVERPNGPWTSVITTESGFVVAIDEGDLVEAACRTDVVVEVLRAVGEHVTRGTPVARVTARGGFGRVEAAQEIIGEIREAVLTGYERTSAQDIGFGIQQLVDIYAKALSPGINDPTTARNSLGHLASALSVLVRRDLSTRELSDDDGVVRVLLPTQDFPELLESAVGPVRTFGCSDVVVVRETMALLRDVGWNAPDQRRREAVANQRDRLLATARRELQDPEDVEAVEVAAERVSAALRQQWS